MILVQNFSCFVLYCVLPLYIFLNLETFIFDNYY